jgi:hypothetical protein
MGGFAALERRVKKRERGAQWVASPPWSAE